MVRDASSAWVTLTSSASTRKIEKKPSASAGSATRADERSMVQVRPTSAAGSIGAPTAEVLKPTSTDSRPPHQATRAE